jgi:TolB-like protein/tetratricopeptide (TPR) repeat protein
MRVNLDKKGSISRKGPSPKTGFGRFVLKLRQRRIITTLAAFIGGGWLLLEFVHWILIDHYHLPETLLDITFLTTLCALLSTLAWRWFREGERKARKVKPEYILIPVLIVVALVFDVRLFLRMGEAESEAHAAPAPQWLNSIAVMPFADLSRANDQDYFCEGMADDIRTKLTRLSSRLKVIARYAMLPYKNNRKPVREIARELDVETILEGSVQKEGDRIRINAQLINARDGSHIWADLYDRKVASVFDVQDEISLTIVKSLEIKLTPGAEASLGAGRPRSVEAYEYLMRGNYIISNTYAISGLDTDFERALEMYKKAFEVEPDYAQAYVGLVWAYEHKYSFTRTPEIHDLALEYAKKSYDLGPNLAETNFAGGYYFFSRNDLDRSFDCYRRALALDPNRMGILHGIALSYNRLGLYHQAIKFYRRVLELSPGYLFSQGNLATCYLYSGDQENAADLIRKVMTASPDNPVYILDEAEILLRRKKPAEAKTILERAAKIGLQAHSRRTSSYLRALLAALNGDRDLALAESRTPDIYALLGMKDEGIQALKEISRKIPAYNNYSYLDLVNNPFLDKLRDDPRFREIVEAQKKVYDGLLKKYGDL